MNIGIDFDNTIISYDVLFHRVATERLLIPPEIPKNKTSVRDYLRECGLEDEWTEIQGYVYGKRLVDACPYKGVQSFFKKGRLHGHVLSIVSHKTKFPFAGPQYDLHVAARCWIEQNGFLSDEFGISEDKLFFELTKEQKLKRIDAIGCDIFIDDLPELLLAKDFPKRVRRILFDPEKVHSPSDQYQTFYSWEELSGLL